MDYVYLALMAASAIYGAYSTENAAKKRPQNPQLTPPDYGALNEFSGLTDWQNDVRSNLLSEYYGGTTANNPVTDNVAEDFWNRDSVRKAYGYHTRKKRYPDGMYDGVMPNPVTGRTETSFTGHLPANQYLAEQSGIVDASQNAFSADLSKYYADRGIADTGQTAGAQSALSTAYDQKRKDIYARSQDIYTMTLGNLFGEVSDAGAQAGGLVANVGRSAQMENQQRQNSYAQAMQRYQYEQNQPSTLGTVASLLPYIANAYMGSSGGTPGVQQTNPNYVNQTMGAYGTTPIMGVGGYPGVR